MTAAAVSTDRAEWNIPLGTLTIERDGAVRAAISPNAKSKEVSAVSPQAVTSLNEAPFLQPTSFRREVAGLMLSWQVGPQAFDLPTIVGEWRKRPAIYLPMAVELAQILCKASGALNNLRTRRFLMSPAQVLHRTDSDGRESWGVLPLPLDDATYGDFVIASTDAVAWTTGDQILQATPVDRSYLAGAVLYYCLIGPLHPASLNRAERMRRILFQRAANVELANSVLTGALPKSLVGLGPRLADFIATLLSPAQGRMMSPSRALLELDLLRGELAPARLAEAWEAEDNLPCAAAILKSFSRRAPEEEVPWALLARLLTLTGDTDASKARDKVPPAIGFQDDDTFIGRVRWLAQRGTEGRTELEEAVALLKRPKKGDGAVGEGSNRAVGHPGQERNPALTDLDFLYLVYVNARWLERFDESLQFLKRDFSVAWYKIICMILSERISLERAAWRDTLRLCRDCRQLIESMPNKGDAAGRYAMAYNDLLDGIVHIRVVEQGFSDVYLEDALVKLQNAWVLLREFASDEMDAVIVGWLIVLYHRIAGPGLLRASADAFFHSIEVDPAKLKAGSEPGYPWFKETQVFGA